MRREENQNERSPPGVGKKATDTRTTDEAKLVEAWRVLMAQVPLPKEAKLVEAWRVLMAQVPLPKKGSFEASYPDLEWHEVPSVEARPYPMLPRRGPRPFIVGNRNDISAQAPTGFISSATGSFPSVVGVTSESGQNNGMGPAVANAYTLQLNTNFFASTVAGSPPGCTAWEQFVYSDDGTSGLLYIQYWLINYGTTSPGPGWINGGTGLTSDWYLNSSATAVPNQPITNLGQLSLSGTVSSTTDSCTLSTGGTMYAVTGLNAVDAAAGWTIAEFGVFGNGGGGQANFNSGSTIEVKTEIVYGGTAAPICVAEGFTAETNNLNFEPPAPGASPPGPAIEATISSGASTTASCAYATSVGDTHLTTVKGLLYDFQASGEFVLAEVEPDFVVHTRQVSGAPKWPNASVNSAVATRIGKIKVCICLDCLTVDGKKVYLKDGESHFAPDGVVVLREGNVYLIASESGYSVRATVNSTWIDVSVGLRSCCTEVKGLLTNVNGNVNQIAARDGTVLTNPFNFEELYHHYANSWRVSPKESLLTCGERCEHGIPREPFYASDLDPKVYEHALAVSKRAGVKDGALLDAATLDVAVIGDAAAARAFVGIHAPIAVGRFVGKEY